jgi:uncharacterized coiled-coil protein SlyX
MIEPDPDSEEIKHEIEIGTEEFLGRALGGKTDDRVSILEARIRYLNLQIKQLNEQVREGTLTEEGTADEQRRLTEELRQATNSLAEFKAQQGRQN